MWTDFDEILRMGEQTAGKKFGGNPDFFSDIMDHCPEFFTIRI